MAEEWTPFDGLGAGKRKGASSGKTGPFAVSGAGGKQGTKGTQGTKGAERALGQRYRPLALDGDVSAAPTNYVQGLLQDVAPGGQSARLRAELDELSKESARLRGKIDGLLATGVPATDAQVQGLLRRIRGTDAEYRQRGEVPVPRSLNDRANQIQVALAPPRAGELRPPTVQESRERELRTPPPTAFQKSAGKLGGGIEHLVNLSFPMLAAGRQADLAAANKAEQDADAAARLPRPGTAKFGRMAPAAAVMDRFFPTGTQYGAAQVNDIAGSQAFQRARAGVSPETREHVDRMVARLRALNGRTTDANQGTAEMAGLVADVATGKLFGLAGEGARELSRVKAVAKYGAETVAEAEKRGFLDSLMAGAKTLAQDTRIRASMGAAQGGVTMAGQNALNEAVAGKPEGNPWRIPLAAGQGLLLGGVGGAASETLAPLRMKDAPATLRAGQEIPRGSLNFGVVEPLAALLEGERDPQKLLERTGSGLLFGAVMQAPHAGKELFTKPELRAPGSSGAAEPPSRPLQPGDRVRVPGKPELGTATVREVKGGRAVLRPDQRPSGAGVVKVRVGAVEPLRPAHLQLTGLPNGKRGAEGKRVAQTTGAEPLQADTERATGTLRVAAPEHQSAEMTGTARSAERTGRTVLQAGDVVRVPSKPELSAATVREVKAGFAVLRPENKPPGTGVVKVRVHELEPLPGSSRTLPTTQPKIPAVPRSRELDSQALLPIGGELRRKLSLYGVGEEQRQVLHDYVNERKARTPIEVRRFDLEQPELMLTLPHEDWIYHFPDTPQGHDQIVSTLHELYGGRQIPPELGRHAQRFYFSSQPSAKDAYWREVSGNPSFWVKAGGGGGDVIAYCGLTLSTGDVSHELVS